MLGRSVLTLALLLTMVHVGSNQQLGPIPDPIQVHGGGANAGSSSVDVTVKRVNGPAPELTGASHPILDSGSASSDNPNPCWYTPTDVLKGDPRIEGDEPAVGVLYLISCPDAINLDTGKLVYVNNGFYWASDGAVPVTQPRTAQQLGVEAMGRLTATDPIIGLGPEADKLAVKIPTWLWVENPAPVHVTVGIPGLSATATAVIMSTTWSMGEPINLAAPAVQTPAFTCQGTGQPPPAKVDPSTTPPCGYIYNWKSLKTRNGGTGTWAVKATTNWAVTWTATNGMTGALDEPLVASTTVQVAVGEWRSSLVNGSGG